MLMSVPNGQYLINSAFLSFFWGCQILALIAILKTPAGSILFNSWLNSDTLLPRSVASRLFHAAEPFYAKFRCAIDVCTLGSWMQPLDTSGRIVPLLAFKVR